MFDLENSIADWRLQMLAAGIKTPVPLEELEIHLREEIEQQMKSRLNEQDAFSAAVQKIGEAGLLKTEFQKSGDEDKTVRTYRVLGLLWLLYCSGSLFSLTLGLASDFQSPNFKLVPLLFILPIILLFGYICLRGVTGSILLYRGVMRERRFIRLIAILLTFFGVVLMITMPNEANLCAVCAQTIFCLVSVWLLRPPQRFLPILIRKDTTFSPSAN